MNHLYKFAVLCGICCLIFTGCKKDSDESNPGALSGNTLSGKISNWTGGNDKKLVAIQETNYTILGSTPISSDGSFSLSLMQNGLTSLDPISDEFDYGLTISDPSAECTSLYLEVMDANDYYQGELMRATATDFNFAKGFAMVAYYYCTKSCKVSGTLTDSGSGYSEVGKFNVTLKQGWNTVVSAITKYSITSTSETIEYTVSNSEPSGVKWYYNSSKK